jgi:speckle-type POZ protein
MYDGPNYAQFELEVPAKKKLAVGRSSVISKDVSAGCYKWRIDFYPRGCNEEDNGEFVSIFLNLVSNSNNVEATLKAFVLNIDGAQILSTTKKLLKIFPPDGIRGNGWGWKQFVERSDLECYAKNGIVTIVCCVDVEAESLVKPIYEPPSDIGSHFGKLLDSTKGSDVSFVIGSETFPAHRAVLAARSPVFRAQLLGSMADAKMTSITLHDIDAATFKVMLRFIYTDALPEDDEIGDSPTKVFEDLLALADRYALDRLKLLCASKLWKNLSVDTFASTLLCAETYNSIELKRKCIAFFAEEKNFKNVVLPDGYIQLMQKFPSILAELREKIGS